MSADGQLKTEYVIENATKVIFGVQKGGPLTSVVGVSRSGSLLKEAEVGLRGRLNSSREGCLVNSTLYFQLGGWSLSCQQDT